jgi:arylsulfatase A-like enzyme/tetratricopeptide (TPR) repeat protein
LRRPRLWLLIAALLLAGGLAGWFMTRGSGAAALGSHACERCNVLLVTIDTLRLDRVGAFGSTRNLTPTLDRLASEGTRLTRVYASAPLTLPSHASILTAVSPPVHGLRANGLFRLGPNLPTLATILKGAGYRTGAFVGAFVLDARFGLNRGFDVYDDRYGERPTNDAAEGAERRAEDVVRPATAWILGAAAPASRGSELGDGSPHPSDSASPQPLAPTPWFAWVHLYDPHEPYRAPEPYASQHEPYDAEVAYADAMVGTLLDDLHAAGQLGRTLIVVAADHGEGLGEHGERTHGVFVYESTMRVPVILSAFGVRRSAFSFFGSGFLGSGFWGSGFWGSGSTGSGSRFDGMARLIDLAPTMLDVIGVAAPASFEGRSVIGGNGAASAYVEAMDANLTRNWAPLTGIVTEDRKFIDLPIPELYDLHADPGEATNLFAREADRGRTLQSLLRSTLSEFAARGSSGEKTALSADARQRLQALGYVASSVDPSARTYGDADDPKTLIGPANDLQRAVTAFNSGSRAQAMADVHAIMERHRQFATAYGMYASMQRQTGDLRGAIATLEDLARRGLADENVMVVLAGYLQEAGDSRRALQVLDAVVAAHPDAVEAYNSLGVIYTRVGDHARARAAFGKVLELDPTSAKAYENRAADELSARELDAAIGDLTRALDLDPHLYDALYNLALALEATGRRADARPHIERFIREAPQPRYAREVAEFRGMLSKP